MFCANMWATGLLNMQCCLVSGDSLRNLLGDQFKFIKPSGMTFKQRPQVSAAKQVVREVQRPETGKPSGWLQQWLKKKGGARRRHEMHLK